MRNSKFVDGFLFVFLHPVIFMMIIALIAKLLWRSSGGEEETIAVANENSRLLSSKEEALFSSYGTSNEDDRYCLESGKFTFSFLAQFTLDSYALINFYL